MSELAFELPLGGGDTGGGGGRGRLLRDVAALWRDHVPSDDPLRAYADTLDHPAYERVLRGYLTGSLDLVLRVGGRYLVADYKTTWLGDPAEPLTVEAYAPQRLGAAMARSSYPLQALLYAVALHRFLRWRLAGYRFDEHVGGVLYLYVRGMAGPETPFVDGEPCGVFSWRPTAGLVGAVSDLLDGIP
jgi:exodeoxyribonuclease V beta subunit